MAFNLADYETVETRLEKFWEQCPDGRIETELLVEGVTHGYIVKARIFRNSTDTRFWASGLAQEDVTDKGVNSTSALENCETSAIGRALANAGFAAKGKRASREEMAKVNNKETVARVAVAEKKLENSGWSASTAIGQALANAGNKDEMPVADTPKLDPWDVPFDAAEQSNPDAECEHGDRSWRTAKDNSWGGWFCPTPKGTPGQCKPIWYNLNPITGEWAK